MVALAADENFNNRVYRALLRHRPGLDIARAQDAGLSGADDPTILEWAAREGRILLTHDVSTMTQFAYERVSRGESMPGVFQVPMDAPIGSIVTDILLLSERSLPGEWEGQVRYFPLR